MSGPKNRGWKNQGFGGENIVCCEGNTAGRQCRGKKGKKEPKGGKDGCMDTPTKTLWKKQRRTENQTVKFQSQKPPFPKRTKVCCCNFGFARKRPRKGAKRKNK